jgi:DNA-binding IclR family transcriptional regulator
LTSLRALEQELGVVRTRGYATAVDELEVGLTAVAAPVLNVAGECVASLSASGPGFRLMGTHRDRVITAVRHAAGDVSRRLGWLG